MTKSIRLKDETYIKLWRILSKRRHEQYKKGNLVNYSYDDTINYLCDKENKEVKEHEPRS
jgi:hypothetical protein